MVAVSQRTCLCCPWAQATRFVGKPLLIKPLMLVSTGLAAEMSGLPLSRWRLPVQPDTTEAENSRMYWCLNMGCVS